MNSDDVLTPIIRWAGSKRQLLPKLIGLAPNQYDRYIEPFCGSVCLFLALRPPQAILGDLNRHLINTYSTLKQQHSDVAHLLRSWPNTKEQYLRIRSIVPGTSAVTDAARFLFLNRLCFNGVYRENLNGEFNVPFGGSRTGTMPSESDLAAFASRLRNATLVAGDFENVLSEATDGDFVYLDPPYTYSGRNRGEYGLNAFSDRDLKRLIVALRGASKRRAKILISFNSMSAIRRAFPNWKLTYQTVRRSVAGFSARRRLVREFQLRNF